MIIKQDFINYEVPFYFEKAKSVGTDMPNMHYHNKYEIYYLKSGSKKHFVDDTYFEIQEGDFVVIPKLIPHKTGGSVTTYRYLVYFDDDFLNKWLTPKAQDVILKFFEKRFIRPPKELQTEISQVFTQMESSYNKRDEEKAFLSFLQLANILNDAPKAIMEGPQSALHDIMKYSQEHYGEINNLQDIADALFISKYHICHLFSKYVEIPFNVYLNRIRLKAACEKLVDTQASITEIAQICGFTTATYFCNIFKKQLGVSPLVYRKLNAKKETTKKKRKQKPKELKNTATD